MRKSNKQEVAVEAPTPVESAPVESTPVESKTSKLKPKARAKAVSVVEAQAEAPAEVEVEVVAKSRASKPRASKPRATVVEAEESNDVEESTELEAEAEESNDVEAVEVPSRNRVRKFTVARNESAAVEKKASTRTKSAAKSPRTKSPVASPRTKSAAKSPRTKSPVASRSKSPAASRSKSPAAKAPRAKSAPKKPVAVAVKKAGVRKGAVKAAPKVVKPKRVHNTKPTTIDFAGIGIGPARVKKVLTHVALNPKEYAVRLALQAAENKPVRPKPTDEVPNPEMPPQGYQTPIDKLPAHVLEMVNHAEKVHFDALNDEYERSVYKTKTLDAKKKVVYVTNDVRVAYDNARKEASNVNKENFNLREFNLSYDKHFYDGFDAFCDENDSYQPGRKFKNAKTGVEREKHNVYTRAAALVNKLGIRLSSETRNILACYLDNLVIQYARNGIHNCIREKLSIVQLRHALTPDAGFEDRVPLDAFARTLTGYQKALDWLEDCREQREEARKHKEAGDDAHVEPNKFPESEYDEDFRGYVVEICRSVRMVMATEQKVATNRTLYLNTSISKPFKEFCSIIVYEAIKRVGSILREVVDLTGVKTVSDSLMYHALKQIHNVCGIDFTSVEADMKVRLARFDAWRSDRRNARKAKKDHKNDEEEDEEAEEEAEEEELEAEEEAVEEEEAEEEEAAEEEELDVEYDEQ